MLKRAFNFYINSSIHVSLAVVSLVAITFQCFQLSLNINLLIFIFLGSITGYNFVKYAGLAKLYYRTLATNLKVIQGFSLIAFLGFIYSCFFQPVSVLIVAGIMGLFTILYAIPVFSKNRNLRALTGVKIYVIAFVWAGVTVLLPVVDKMDFFQMDFFLEFLQRFCFIIALTLPFEIRDLKFDLKQLRTIPQKIGVKKTKLVGLLLILVFVLLEFLKQNSSLAEGLSVLFVGMITSIFLINSGISQKEYYSSFWVEGIPIIWWLILSVLGMLI
ncbi:hypothetical protein ACKGJN_00720 [Gillisia sp. Q332]|uniref:hypothetical protein n=1 Tax=Gillisia xinjiangensis TaxID=3384765 RepID=UPI00391BD0CD